MLQVFTSELIYLGSKPSLKQRELTPHFQVTVPFLKPRRESAKYWDEPGPRVTFRPLQELSWQPEHIDREFVGTPGFVSKSPFGKHTLMK